MPSAAPSPPLAADTSRPPLADPAARLPALDGLRAFAVCAVVVFHFAPGALPGGFLGVDVFFVVSGFFIARIVTVEIHRTGTIGLGNFLARRVRRLLPALAAMALAVIVASAIWLAAADRTFLRRELFGVLLYSANWVLLRSHGSYFASVGRPSPFLHTWTLAVEEQFYLVLPLLAFALRKTIRTRPLLVVAGALAAAVGSTMWMAHLAAETRDPTRAYFGSDSHSMGLLVGVALGIVAGSPLGARLVARAHARKRTGFATPVTAALFAALAVPMWLCSGQTVGLYRGGFLAFSVGCGALIALIVAFPTSAIGRVLQTRPAVEIGLRPYSLYLWHWPVCVFVDGSSGLDGARLFLVRTALTVVLAELSFRLVERPFRSGAVAARSGTRGASIAYLSLAAVAVVVAMTLMTAPAPQPTELAAALTQLKSTPVSRPPAPPRAAGHEVSAPAPPLPVDVYGDSTAFEFGYDGGIHRGSLDVAIVGDARFGCGLEPGQPISRGYAMTAPKDCAGWQQRWTSAVRDGPGHARVLMTGAWDLFDYRFDGRVLRVGTAEWTDLVTRSYLEAFHALTADGGSVHVFELPCYGPGTPTDSFPERADPTRVAAVNAIINGLARQVPRVSVVHWRGLVCPNGVRAETVDGVRLWLADDVHLSDAGSVLVWRWLLPQLAHG